MSALSPREQQLFNVAKAALPAWYFQDDDQAELVAAFARQFGKAWDQVDLWCDQMFITRAFGIFLDQHAKDKGTRRQNGESDQALALRLRTIEDAVTLPALQAKVDAILLADGVAGTATILELRAHKAFVSALPATGITRAFISRGYRIGKKPPKNELVIMLPYGTSEATGLSVAEGVRQKKGGGTWVRVEVRRIP